jgi:hypothetical protein
MPINIFLDFKRRDGAFILFLIDNSKKARALFSIEYYQEHGWKFDIFWLGLKLEF